MYNVRMAEESGYKQMSGEDLALTVIVIVVVLGAIQRIPGFLQEKLGFDIGSTYLVASAVVDNATPLGTRVATLDGTSYADEADGEEVGTFPPGTSLVLVAGPQTVVGGAIWWRVESRVTGKTGWVPESTLIVDGLGGVGYDTKVGARVRSMTDVNVWRSAGGDHTIGIFDKGAYGTLSDGPEVVYGSRWWFVNRSDSSADGWVPEAALMRAADRAWKEGTIVRALYATDLFERAGGGATLGTLEEGEGAKIGGAPFEVSGAYWWPVGKEDGTTGWVAESALEEGGPVGWMSRFLVVLVTLGTVFAVVLLCGVVYATIRTNQIRAKDAQRIRNAMPRMEVKRNDRWDKVMEHVSTDNPNDWRLAIIEADIMLDEIVTRMGYPGQSLGDKLKQATRGDIKNLDAAWEAHRVRNQIAHAGSDFILTQREARRVIELYGRVFEEFKFI